MHLLLRHFRLCSPTAAAPAAAYLLTIPTETYIVHLSLSLSLCLPHLTPSTTTTPPTTSTNTSVLPNKQFYNDVFNYIDSIFAEVLASTAVSANQVGGGK